MTSAIMSAPETSLFALPWRNGHAWTLTSMILLGKEKPPMHGVDLIGDQQGWQVGKSGPGIKLSTIVRAVLL